MNAIELYVKICASAVQFFDMRYSIYFPIVNKTFVTKCENRLFIKGATTELNGLDKAKKQAPK